MPRKQPRLTLTMQQVDDIIDALQRSDCQFWACPGYDKPFKNWHTCARCTMIQRLIRWQKKAIAEHRKDTNHD